MTPTARSRIMRAIKKQDTRPEIAVRKMLHAMGYRFRLHRSDLPGTPDIVLPGRRTVVFVHGCFWHQHPGCAKGRMPTSRQDYWQPKLLRNVARDTTAKAELEQAAWKVTVVWECELADLDSVRERLASTIPTRTSAVVGKLWDCPGSDTAGEVVRLRLACP